MTPREAFEELGLATNASEDDVKKAYRKLASKHHPDKGGDKEDFQRVHEAYTVALDNIGKAHLNDDPFFGGFGADNLNEFIRQQKAQARQRSYTFNDNVDPNAAKPKLKPRTVTDHPSVYLTLREAYHGCNKTIVVKTQRECEHCGGIGWLLRGYAACQPCDGKGKREEFISVNARIQPRVSDVSYVKECHHPDVANIIRLTVKTLTTDGPFTRVDKDHIERDVVVPFDVAILGGEVMTQTYDGADIRLKIPRGTQAATRLRVPHHGFTDVGHLYCDIVITVPSPDSISAAALQALTTYQETTRDNEAVS